MTAEGQASSYGPGEAVDPLALGGPCFGCQLPDPLSALIVRQDNIPGSLSVALLNLSAHLDLCQAA